VHKAVWTSEAVCMVCRRETPLASAGNRRPIPQLSIPTPYRLGYQANSVLYRIYLTTGAMDICPLVLLVGGYVYG
jgi:hypothetical protein